MNDSITHSNTKDVLNQIIKIVDDFKNRKINFSEYKGWLNGKSSLLSEYINFKYDLVDIVDNWLEYIEYCYLEVDWFSYGLEVGEFLINSIKVYPEEVELPKDSRVVLEQFKRYLD